MKKRKGIALISVLVLFVFITGLAIGLLGLYLSSVKQSVNVRTNEQLNYSSISGLNIVSSYVMNKNTEFLVKYNEFLANNGNDRTKPFEIPLSQDGYECVVSITSTYSEDNSTGVVVKTIVYTLSSESTFNEQESLPVTVEIKQTIRESNNEFEVGKVQ